MLAADWHASCRSTKLKLWLKSLAVKLEMCFEPHSQCVGLTLSQGLAY